MEAQRKYRASTLGQTLGQTLLELIEEGTLQRKEATAILEAFDDVMRARVAEVAAPTPVTVLEGDLDFYKSCEGLWQLRIRNPSVPLAPNITSLFVLAEERDTRRAKRPKF